MLKWEWVEVGSINTGRPTRYPGAKITTYRIAYPQQIERAKVPGGWLVAFSEGASGAGSYGGECGFGSGGLTFYPDPNHRWDGSSLK